MMQPLSERTLFSLFEKLLHPYPDAEPAPPPDRFLPFMWASTEGLRGYILALVVLGALVSGFEAWLFAMLGQVVDWAAKTPPDRFVDEHATGLSVFGAILVASVAAVALESFVKRQGLAINFPFRLRWNFHRLMLGQSMSFYADEFAGRITTKVMQTGLAVRDVIFKAVEVLIGMGVYFITFMALAATFDRRRVLPMLGWVVMYGSSCT
jgi:ATP-binding cassette subfamily B multidrug efflux pump